MYPDSHITDTVDMILVANQRREFLLSQNALATGGRARKRSSAASRAIGKAE